VEDNGATISVQMGKVSFDSDRIPVTGTPREVLNEEICADGKSFRFCAATIGNPHCIVLNQEPSPLDARRYGALIENDSRFPNRINVQFMNVLDQRDIQIEIWERGAGYTLSSGSSSTAAAAVSHRLGLCGPDITVHMPGGDLKISFSDSFMATMTGPVTKVCAGVMTNEMLVYQ
jgi:diaminopimelate epimerase